MWLALEQLSGFSNEIRGRVADEDPVRLPVARAERVVGSLRVAVDDELRERVADNSAVSVATENFERLRLGVSRQPLAVVFFWGKCV